MNDLEEKPSDDLIELAREQLGKASFSVEESDSAPDIRLGKNTFEDQVEILNALGVSDLRFGDGLVHQIANLSNGKRPDERSMNFVLGFMREVEPRDQFEALLTLQMAATHIVAMASARTTLAASHIQAKDGAANRMTKMTRTYVAQLEALKKHRAKASQTVRVERVEVKEGGQAIVGDVMHGGDETKNAR